ncbi:MAG: DUF2934 domain-containing protein [Acidobacteriia bacterium]|nr:DUF2934 domain-containing protein [Terriglobia bacterium]
MSTAPKMAVSPIAPETTDHPSASHEEIAQLAYQYWEDRGRPLGSPEEDWLRAESDILMERLVWGDHSTPGSESAHSGQRFNRKPRTS